MQDHQFEMLREFFHSVGLLASDYRFEKIVPREATRTLLQKKPNEAAKILIHSPDLFVMPASLRGKPNERIKCAIAQTFFVKLLTANATMSLDEYNTYIKYYPVEKFVLAGFEEEKLRLFNLSTVKPLIKGKTATFKIPKTALIKNFLQKANIDKEIIPLATVEKGQQ